MKGIPRQLGDISGTRFARLLVLALAPEEQQILKKRRRWICACDCGTFTLVPTDRLRSKETKSCGCLHRETFALRNPNERLRRQKLLNEHARAVLRLRSRAPDMFDYLFGRAA